MKRKLHWPQFPQCAGRAGRVALKPFLFSALMFFGLLTLMELTAPFLLRHLADGPHAPDPLLFWKLIPGYEGPFNGLHVRINRKGLRSPDQPYRKAAGEFRILALGESTTFGAFLTAEETYPAQLQNYLDNRLLTQQAVVINAGVSGYNSFQGLEFFKREGYRYQPDILLIYFLYNEYRITSERSFLRLGEIPYSDRELYEQHQRWLRFVPFLPQSHLFSLFEYVNYLATSRLAARIDPATTKKSLATPYFRLGWKDGYETLASLVKLARSQHIRPILCVPPLRDAIWFQEPVHIKRLEKEDGVDVIDLRDGIAEHPELFFDIVHPTAEGHRLIAQKIAHYLWEKGVVR
jgi:lysophospholipase L1-like esterase